MLNFDINPKEGNTRILYLKKKIIYLSKTDTISTKNNNIYFYTQTEENSLRKFLYKYIRKFLYKN